MHNNNSRVVSLAPVNTIHWYPCSSTSPISNFTISQHKNRPHSSLFDLWQETSIRYSVNFENKPQKNFRVTTKLLEKYVKSRSRVFVFSSHRNSIVASHQPHNSLVDFSFYISNQFSSNKSCFGSVSIWILSDCFICLHTWKYDAYSHEYVITRPFRNFVRDTVWFVEVSIDYNVVSDHVWGYILYYQLVRPIITCALLCFYSLIFIVNNRVYSLLLLNPNAMNNNAVGYSGVLFCYALIESFHSVELSRSVFGMFSVPTKSYPIILLVILQVSSLVWCVMIWIGIFFDSCCEWLCCLFGFDVNQKKKKSFYKVIEKVCNWVVCYSCVCHRW